MADSSYPDAVPGPVYPASAPETRASSPVDEQARAVLMTQDSMLKELRQAYDSMKASYAAELARRDHMIAQLGSKLTEIEAGIHRSVSKTPAPPAPPSFTGSGKFDVQDWLFSLTLYFEAARGYDSEGSRVSYAVNLFKGTALKWWRSYLANHDMPMSMTEFREALLTKFQPVDPVIKARDRLATLKQTKSVTAYTNIFREIAMQIPRMSDDERLDRYIRGLKPKIATEVRLRQPETCETAMLIAERYDEAVFSYDRRPFRAPSPSDMMDVDSARVHRPYHKGRKPSAPSAKIPSGRPAKLSDEERERCIREGRCFYCRETGHTVSSPCPKKAAADARAGAFAPKN